MNKQLFALLLGVLLCQTSLALKTSTLEQVSVNAQSESALQNIFDMNGMTITTSMSPSSTTSTSPASSSCDNQAASTSAASIPKITISVPSAPSSSNNMEDFFGSSGCGSFNMSDMEPDNDADDNQTPSTSSSNCNTVPPPSSGSSNCNVPPPSSSSNCNTPPPSSGTGNCGNTGAGAGAGSNDTDAAFDTLKFSFDDIAARLAVLETKVEQGEQNKTALSDIQDQLLELSDAVDSEGVDIKNLQSSVNNFNNTFIDDILENIQTNGLFVSDRWFIGETSSNGNDLVLKDTKALGTKYIFTSGQHETFP